MFYQDNSVENNVGETEKKESNITAPTVNELSQMFQDMEVSEDENKELSPVRLWKRGCRIKASIFLMLF
jgi:hypothetical protein